MQAETVAEFIDVEELYEYVMALRKGDFSKRVSVPESGRAREVAMHLNRHIESMGRMVAEFTRVAHEVGVEGRLGPQADVYLTGPWQQMRDSLNLLAANVTDNVRDLIWTTDAMNKESRPRRVHENCDGEWKQLKTGINAWVERAEREKAQPAPAPAPEPAPVA